MKSCVILKNNHYIIISAPECLEKLHARLLCSRLSRECIGRDVSSLSSRTMLCVCVRGGGNETTPVLISHRWGVVFTEFRLLGNVNITDCSHRDVTTLLGMKICKAKYAQRKQKQKQNCLARYLHRGVADSQFSWYFRDQKPGSLYENSLTYQRKPMNTKVHPVTRMQTALLASAKLNSDTQGVLCVYMNVCVLRRHFLSNSRTQACCGFVICSN